jgi:NADH-quinone oxidoreductase subunit N
LYRLWNNFDLFLLSGRIEKWGPVREYYALIFFVLCGVGITGFFNTLLMLSGMKSFPSLYILTGSDKQT